MSGDEHKQIVYDFDGFLTKAKEMSDQDPPDIVIFSNLIWSAAVVCLRKFFLTRFQLKILSKNAQEELMEIVLDASTDDAILCERLHGAWTYAKHCRKNAYAMRYMHQPLRKEILQSVANMEAYMNATDIEKIKEKISTSGVKIINFQAGSDLLNCIKIAKAIGINRIS